MNKYHIYFLVLSLSVLIAYLLGGSVIILATALILFDRCLFGRVKIIHGIEFTTISLMMVSIKYDLFISILFCIFILYVFPTIINFSLGDRLITNKNFKVVRIGFGLIIHLLSVIIIFYLKNMDIFLLMSIMLLFGHTLYTLKGKVTQNNFILDSSGIIINIIFNLSLVFFFHSFWLSLLI